MRQEDIELYKRRWQAIADIELEELRKSTPDENWKKLNQIISLAIRLGIFQKDEEQEKIVYRRWAELKAKVARFN